MIPAGDSISYGGGVQSTALLVLAATGRIDFPLFLMANVGDDSEHPATLRYVREVAAPYAAANGIELVELDRIKRDGSTETLRGRLMKPDSRSLPIPVRMSNGAPGTRSCTADFKIKVIARELKRRGFTAGRPCHPHKPTIVEDCDRCVQPNIATLGIGISVDEIHRANNRRALAWERVTYPLLDLRLRRSDCEQIIAAAGIPVPPKSSCYFCPFHKMGAWEDLARDEPALFDDACRIEDTLNDRRERLGKDPVYLTRFAIPLRDAVATNQPLLPMLDDECDAGGYCMT